jgi:PadR family transcriptional regulator PadR
MSRDPRLSVQTLEVLGALTSKPDCELSGAEIGRMTKLASGSLYPILLRLEKAEWLQSRWEETDPRELGRPRRRLYRMTALGQRRIRSAIARTAPLFRSLAWR